MDKYRQVHCSEVGEQIQINFQKYFTEDRLPYAFQHKVYKWAILFIQLRMHAMLEHLDTRCCKTLVFICPFCTTNGAKQNTAQRGCLAISFPKGNISNEF